MSYLAPSEFVTKMVDAGEAKILMSTKDTLIRAVMAGATLALDGKCESIESTEILRIETDRLTVFVNRRLGISAGAIEKPKQEINAAFLRRQLEGTIEPLCRRIEVALAQSQDSPIGPRRGFAGSNLRRLLKAAVRQHIVAHLQRGQAYIKIRNKLFILVGRRRRKAAM